MPAATVIETLLSLAEADPLPPADTSSHWRRFGAETVARRDGGRLILRASGFETVGKQGSRGRVLTAIERWSYRRVTCSLRSYRSVSQTAAGVCRDLGVSSNFNVFKSVCALSVLVDHWDEHGLRPRTAALIGDGFGFFGTLLRRVIPDIRLYCIDLPRQLVFQARMHELADPDATRTVLAAERTAAADLTYLLPSHSELVEDEIDCAVSVASMQEMTRASIAGYFRFLRRRTTGNSRFYCVNRLHKELPGGETTDFYQYPWSPEDEVFVDGPCPYYSHYLSPYSTPSGPRIGGLRVPFVNYFDGIHQHRLVALSRNG